MISFAPTGSMNTVSHLTQNLSINGKKVYSTSAEDQTKLQNLLDKVKDNSLTNTTSAVQKEYDSIFAKNGYTNQDLLEKLENDTDGTPFADFIASYGSSEFGAKTLKEYNFDGMVQTIAAKYAALSNEIQNGNVANKDELQQRLDSQLEQGLSQLSEKLGESASSLLSKLGMDKESANLGQSLTDLIKEQKDKYVEFLNSDEGKKYLEDYAKGNDDIDLENSDTDLTAAILMHEAETRVKEKQEAQKAQEEEKINPLKKDDEEDSKKETKTDPTVTDTGKFTLQDLQSLASIEDALSSFLKEDNTKTEEEMGYQLGLTYVKAKDKLTANGASAHLTNLFETGFDNFVNDKIKTYNDALKDKQKDVEENHTGDASAYASLDTSKIMSVYQNTVSVYKQTGSLDETLVSGFEFAKDSFTQSKQSSNATRYTADNNFFNSFYASDKHNNNNGNMYGIGVPGYVSYRRILTA